MPKMFYICDFNYDLAKTVQNSHVSDFTEIMLNHCFYSLIKAYESSTHIVKLYPNGNLIS